MLCNEFQIEKEISTSRITTIIDFKYYSNWINKKNCSKKKREDFDRGEHSNAIDRLETYVFLAKDFYISNVDQDLRKEFREHPITVELWIPSNSKDLEELTNLLDNGLAQIRIRFLPTRSLIENFLGWPITIP